MATGVDYMYEQRWGFLRPWTHVLRGQFGNYLCRLQSSPFDPTRLYVPVMAFNRSVMTQEGLKLLVAVAHVDYSAWKYLLINHCEVKLGQPWEEAVEGEIVVRFHLTMYRNDRNVQDLVRMCGIHQHDRPSREYLEALARIAAIDNNSHTKSRGVEIPVPIVVLFRNKTDSQRNLDDVLRHRDVGEIIQREWDERALPHVEAGAFRCTFVLGSAKANLSHYQNRANLDMAEKMEELVHANV